MGHTGQLPTSNEEMRDAVLRHQIGLMQVSGRLRNLIFEFLDDTVPAILDQLEGVGGARPVLTAAELERLRRIERAVREIREPAWQEIRDTWRSGLVSLALAESEWVEMTARLVLPVEILLDKPDTAELRALITKQPVQGRLLGAWSRALEVTDRRRIMEQVRAGMVLGESTSTIAGRVRAVHETTKRNAATLTRTAINHVGNRARQAFYLENQDVFTREVYLATLDSRTTAVCRSLDGKEFPIGEGPTPPVHFNCRSVRAPTFDGDELAVRPMKPTTQRILLREYTEANGLARVGNRASLPRGHKGAFDAFARRRTRELIGQVPGRTTYAEFLRRQSVEFQNEVLGVRKALLFRKGGLTLESFVDRAGNEKTLEELLRTEREAFERAGLV